MDETLADVVQLADATAHELARLNEALECLLARVEAPPPRLTLVCSPDDDDFEHVQPRR